MKPAVCQLCQSDCRGASAQAGGAGGYVEFADFSCLPDGMLGHPSGFEWFCSAHLPAAQALAYLPLDEALGRLQVAFADARR